MSSARGNRLGTGVCDYVAVYPRFMFIGKWQPKPCVLCDIILHMLMHLIALICDWMEEQCLNEKGAQ